MYIRNNPNNVIKARGVRYMSRLIPHALTLWYPGGFLSLSSRVCSVSVKSVTNDLAAFSNPSVPSIEYLRIAAKISSSLLIKYFLILQISQTQEFYLKEIQTQH